MPRPPCPACLSSLLPHAPFRCVSRLVVHRYIANERMRLLYPADCEELGGGDVPDADPLGGGGAAAGNAALSPLRGAARSFRASRRRRRGASDETTPAALARPGDGLSSLRFALRDAKMAGLGVKINVLSDGSALGAPRKSEARAAAAGAAAGAAAAGDHPLGMCPPPVGNALEAGLSPQQAATAAVAAVAAGELDAWAVSAAATPPCFSVVPGAPGPGGARSDAGARRRRRDLRSARPGGRVRSASRDSPTPPEGDAALRALNEGLGGIISKLERLIKAASKSSEGPRRESGGRYRPPPGLLGDGSAASRVGSPFVAPTHMAPSVRRRGRRQPRSPAPPPPLPPSATPSPPPL